MKEIRTKYKMKGREYLLKSFKQEPWFDNGWKKVEMLPL